MTVVGWFRGGWLDSQRNFLETVHWGCWDFLQYLLSRRNERATLSKPMRPLSGILNGAFPFSKAATQAFRSLK